jgi:uncharacterized delta-60 repeat protein
MLEQRDLLTAGFYDPTFGDGRATVNFRDLLGSSATASAVAVQPDGKVVIAGSVTSTFGDRYFGVIRLKADGTPDQTFGHDGRQYFGFNDLLGGNDDQANAVAIDAQGRIIVAGKANGTTPYSNVFAVARLKADGYFDPSFGAFGGRTYFGFSDILGGHGDADCNSVAIDAHGRIVLAGTAFTNGDGFSDFGVGRLNDDGYFDASFGAGAGRTYFGFQDVLGGRYDNAIAVALDSQGRIVVAGNADSDIAGSLDIAGSPVYDMAVGRLNDNGYFDTSFGAFHGKTYFHFRDILGGINDFADAMAIDAQDRIVVAGSADGDSAHAKEIDFAVARLNDNGYFDTSFGAFHGRTYFGFRDILGDSYAGATAVAVDTQGRIILAGEAGGTGFGPLFAVGRLNDNGYFDASFGAGAGRTYTRFRDQTGATNDLDYCAAVALDAQGNIVMAGTSSSNITGSSYFAVTRLYGDTQNPLGSVSDLTGASFSLTSLEDRTSHGVVIQTQRDNGDGTAFITGMWDSHPLAGTVQYDAKGNIHIFFQFVRFPGGPVETFYGTISGSDGAYQLDGMVVVPGGSGPGHCAGRQIV